VIGDAPVQWLPPKPVQIDPKKDVEATVAEIAAGLTSRAKAVAERGWSIAELDRELAADCAREAALGLEFGQPAKESTDAD
jgi:capsid protein